MQLGFIRAFAAGAAFLAVSACTGSPGSVSAVAPVADPNALTRYRTLVIQAGVEPPAPCTTTDLDRLAELTRRKVEELAPGRFTTIHARRAGEPPRDGAGEYLAAELTVTCYDRGSAAARALLAGLGSIRIAGELALSAAPGGRERGRYDLEKRFAWGGIYGAMTDIEDVEVGFAEAAAEAIVGKR